MVWHKGKVYCFGGKKTSGTLEYHNPYIYDFTSKIPNIWSSPSATITNLGYLQRQKAAAVSFGNEIFLFGGLRAKTSPYAVAWNTETNAIREVFFYPPTNLGELDVSAAAFGPYIYLFGGRDDPSSPASAKNGIYRFTP